MGLVPFQKRHQGPLYPLPREDATRRLPRAGAGRGLSPELDRAGTCSQTSRLQNCGKGKGCCLNPPVHGVLRWQHEQTKTEGKRELLGAQVPGPPFPPPFPPSSSSFPCFLSWIPEFQEGFCAGTGWREGSGKQRRAVFVTTRPTTWLGGELPGMTGPLAEAR